MEKKLIYTVDDVQLTLTRTTPPLLRVEAKGQTRTTGWTEPELSVIRYVTPPADGIQDLDFIALPPSGPSDDTLADIRILLEYGEMPEWLKGVRVRAETNAKEALLRRPYAASESRAR